MPQLFPFNPSETMVIRNVTPNIVTMSLPFARFGIMRFGGRGTLVKLSTGSLAVISPVSLTPEVRAKVESLGGNVKYIAAPDLQHHLNITAWKKAFPQAKILAPEGLWEKRQSNPEFRETQFQHVFKKDAAPPMISEEWHAEFETEYVHGHGSRELVFLHKPSRTVIEADLLFNLPANEQYSKTEDKEPMNFATKLVLPLLSSSSYPATGQRRFAWYILSSHDRTAFTESVRRIARWDFDRLIPCHGDVIETSAKSVFQNVMAWFLREDSKHV
ncbi:hypothetical protein N7532_006457 [Penicillium argentinense]|uniref:Beta-lactamase-like protein n=1 Tax=Penicillium argentinense TaxID=1131581 RepID=A0A9W9FFZ0_9EURO|nr:uncharacterized protein N7532_006457 [Penicillium argentinense]KAJ5099456.1 hypothetical protein N7532_006457 [Penicillium argentinense]